MDSIHSKAARTTGTETKTVTEKSHSLLMDNETAKFLIEAFRAQDIQTQKKLDKMIEQNQAIYTQTLKTNGRVTALEKRVDIIEKETDELEANKNVNLGRDKVIWYVGLAVVAVIWYIAQNSFTLKIK